MRITVFVVDDSVEKELITSFSKDIEVRFFDNYMTENADRYPDYEPGSGLRHFHEKRVSDILSDLADMFGAIRKEPGKYAPPAERFTPDYSSSHKSMSEIYAFCARNMTSVFRIYYL